MLQSFYIRYVLAEKEGATIKFCLLTSIKYATENCHYPELVGEPVRLELNFTFPLEDVFELIVLGTQMSAVAVDIFGVLEKNV